MTTPCIITCAITGSLPKKADNPAVPVTPAEQIESTHAAFWNEVRDRDSELQAATIVDPPFQRTVSMAMAKSKGPARAVTAVAVQIVLLVNDMARAGMWRPSGLRQAPAHSCFARATVGRPAHAP